jgi:uncharacterized protein
MEILALTAFLLIGIFAGLCGGMLGLSGGVIAVPCLVLLYKLLDFPADRLMQLAIGTSLAAMLINTAVASIAHYRRNGIVWEMVLSLLPGVVLGCLIGSALGHILSSKLLKLLFGFFIFSMGAYLLLKRKSSKERKRPSRTFLSWIGLGIGTVASLLGIGGGVFVVPLLISYHYAEKKAVGTSAVVTCFLTLIAALSYFYLGLGQVDMPYTVGYIYLPAFLLIGVGGSLFAPLGAKFAHQMDGSKLRKILAITLIFVGILMIFA